MDGMEWTGSCCGPFVRWSSWSRRLNRMSEGFLGDLALGERPERAWWEGLWGVVRMLFLLAGSAEKYHLSSCCVS